MRVQQTDEKAYRDRRRDVYADTADAGGLDDLAAREVARAERLDALAPQIAAIVAMNEAPDYPLEVNWVSDADALFEIYDLYKSYYRSDVNAPQLVKRAEAERIERVTAFTEEVLLNTVFELADELRPPA